jgi:hypothetical protein
MVVDFIFWLTQWCTILAAQVSCGRKEKLLALGVYPDVTLADAR